MSFYIQTYNKLLQQQQQQMQISSSQTQPQFFLPVHHFFSAHYNSLIQSSSQSSNVSLAAAVFSSMIQKSYKSQLPKFMPILASMQEESESASSSDEYALPCIMAAAATIPKRVALAAKRKQESLPKPFLLEDLEKQRHDCGEDAFFVATELNYIDPTSNTKTVAALGIADGVGGYARLDIDPSLMAWQLMENAKSCLLDAELDEQCPREVMAHAYNTIRSKEQVAAGGCTACILVIQRDLSTNKLVLRSANLGDSGYLVIRNGEIIYKTTEVTHGFNAPFQLAIPPKNHPTPVFQDDPSDAHMPESPVELQEGDVIVLGTDGIFDNIFDTQVQEIVQRNFAKFSSNEQAAVNQTVADLVELSRDNSLSRSVDTPFAKAARENSYYHKGGKPDDITCVVAVVRENQNEKL